MYINPYTSILLFLPFPLSLSIYIYMCVCVCVLYTRPVNINGYVPFLINTLDTIVWEVFLLSRRH